MSQKKKSPGTSKTLTPTASKVAIEEPKAEKVIVVPEHKAGSALVFSWDNIRWMLIGFAVMIFGFILMSGGSMPDTNTWDESIIYSFRRITLAPFVILLGLGIEIYAIFKSPGRFSFKKQRSAA